MRLTAKFRLRTLLGMLTICCLAISMFAPAKYVIRYDTSQWAERRVTQVGNAIQIWSYREDGQATNRKLIVRDARVLRIELRPSRIDEIEIRITLYQKIKLWLHADKFWIYTDWGRGASIWTPDDNR